MVWNICLTNCTILQIKIGSKSNYKFCRKKAAYIHTNSDFELTWRAATPVEIIGHCTHIHSLIFFRGLADLQYITINIRQSFIVTTPLVAERRSPFSFTFKYQLTALHNCLLIFRSFFQFIFLFSQYTDIVWRFTYRYKIINNYWSAMVQCRLATHCQPPFSFWGLQEEGKGGG